MKTLCTIFSIGLLIAMLNAQETRRPSRARPKTEKKAQIATAEEVKALRDALAAQQQQIQELRQELRQRDQQWQQVQTELQQTQRAARTAQEKAAVAATQGSDTVSKLSSDVADVKANMTTAALNTQDEQKRVSGIESLLGRFRFTGDIRVRQEDFFQSYSGCNTDFSCTPRIRERIRLRLGIEGKLNEDFTGGVAFASGVLTDPTSTNDTLTNVFEKKTIGFDRGYITYNPQAHKWLSVTGGKFAYTWQRTNQTFDPDLNPEGFTEKLSFDVPNKFLQSVNFQGIQLLFNEVSKGPDSFAAGGQIGARLKPARRVIVNTSYTLLNWRNEDAILNEPLTVTGGNSPIFAPNGNTNDTFTLNGVNHFRSRFLYSDFIADTSVDTGWAKLPWRILLEAEDNLRAFSNRSHSYLAETSLGQLKNRGDFLFGYAFLRQEQDSVLAAFNESDQRAPTNVLQHRLYVQYQIRNNTALSFTDWIGRTLDTSQVNSVKAAGIKAGQKEPYLNRLQFDLIYKF